MNLLDGLLLGALLITAVVAVCVPRRAAATTAFLIFGILLALLWGRFGAPDIALAEAALGGGVAGALLVDALERRQPPLERRSGRSAAASLVVVALAGAASLVLLLGVVRNLSAEPSPLRDAAIGEIEGTGVTHPITAVLLSYRSLDTLLEIAVLVIAAFAACAVARESFRPLRATDPIRRALAILVLPALLMVAIWILVAGTSRPGGAFQAGALIGAGLVIAHLTGMPMLTPSLRVGLLIAGVSLAAFIGLAAIGFAITGAWFGMEPAWAGAAILTIEAVLAVGIGVALALVFLSAGARDAHTPRLAEVGR